MDNPILRRIVKFLLFIVVLAAIFVAIALFFAFGGDNPILPQIGSVIDIVLTGLTFAFIVAIIYRIVLMTGYGADTSAKTKSGAKSAQTSTEYAYDDEFPDLNQLVDNLETMESSK